MTQKSNARHRSQGEVKVLETFELRSRRSIREAERARQSRSADRAERKLATVAKLDGRALPVQPVEKAQGKYVVRPHAAPKKVTKRVLRDLVAMGFASGIFATAALPAYALSPDVVSAGGFTTISSKQLATDYQAQSLTISAINQVEFGRGDYKATPLSETDRQNILNAIKQYTGPTASDFIANPPYSKLDPADVLKVAAKYVGTPYVFGGENPGGFDCSGYVRYVYAQFGINLPHSVIGQSFFGIKVKFEDAMPGDIVVLNNLSHDGIYAGNGNFYHAPRPGDDVKLAPIFTDQVYFIRLQTN